MMFWVSWEFESWTEYTPASEVSSQIITLYEPSTDLMKCLNSRVL
jgi:hypothetical protein